MSEVVEEFWKADKDGVKLMSLREERRVNYAEFIAKMQLNRVATPVLPYGTIMYREDKTDTRYLIQVPPKVRTIPYFKQFFKIGFPSLVILVKVTGKFIGNAAMAGAVGPIYSEADALIRVPLPNVDNRGILCMGYDFDVESSNKSAVLERIGHMLSYIEASKYNDHLLPDKEWIPQEFVGSVKYDTTSDAMAKDYEKILENWSAATSGEDWLKKVRKINWVPFKTVDEFMRCAI